MTPFRVGLTGGIGCGKSTVAALFEALGVPTIDADDVARAVTSPGQPALDRIVTAFGGDVVSGGQLDRRVLRQRVFASASARRRLEAIIHPLVYNEMDRWANQLDAPYCLLCIPLLFETAPPHFVQRILVVDCSVDQQLRRAATRDGMSETEIRRIVDSQATRQHRIDRADDIIDNNRGPEALQARVGSLHTLYLGLARASRTDSCDQPKFWTGT